MRNSFENTKTSLEIEEHVDEHKLGFKIQKVGVIFILAVVIVAAAGLFGDGILSSSVATAPQGKIEYDRFYRFEARMEVKVEALDAQRASNIISFSSDYLKHLQIESITPSPGSSRFQGNNTEFVFDGVGNTIVTFYLIPRKMGNIPGEIMINGTSFKVNHFIYP